MSTNRKIEDEIVDGIFFKKHPEGRFAVSECGKVLGKLGRILKQKSQGHYKIVSYQVYIDSIAKIRHKYVHRLVAEVWLEKPSELHEEVNHKDGNKDNNSTNNLEWVTRTENVRHAVDNKLAWNMPKQGQCGFRRKDGQDKYN